MSMTFQRRTLIVALGVFGLGVAIGFSWALLRPHPMSDYRKTLADDTVRSQG